MSPMNHQYQQDEAAASAPMYSESTALLRPNQSQSNDEASVSFQYKKAETSRTTWGPFLLLIILVLGVVLLALALALDNDNNDSNTNNGQNHVRRTAAMATSGCWTNTNCIFFTT